ncbi:MAG: DUF3419 family protein [Thermoguttaceae bacterium]|nr:DUF3419 family protein [Thermoguttaceae bacterium]
MSIQDWLSARVFRLVHGHQLVYNTCWEDPRLDRVALELGPRDRVLVITSAGCNALDYALAGAGHVYAVDVNPRQNALLELKIAGIRRLEFDDYFALFGAGKLPLVRQVYQRRLRNCLSPWARRYWDRHVHMFDGPGQSFYFRGAAGSFARLINLYIDRLPGVRPWLQAMLAAKSLQCQREIYAAEVREQFWGRSLRFLMRRDAVLAMIGVPAPQRRQIETQYGGIVRFIQDCLDAVFGELPLGDNYFWRVYLTGRYSPECCPEYLTRHGFQRLKDGVVDRVSVHTASVAQFLQQSSEPISRFVLLDHMDWLAEHRELLDAEWQAIFDRAAPGSRAIWRSGGLRTDYLDDVHVRRENTVWALGDLLRPKTELACGLHARCRVHTYGSFHIADLVA